MNPLKSEKFLLWFGIAVTMIVALVFSRGDLISACIAGMIFTLIACVVYGTLKKLTPTWSKRVLHGSMWCLIPFGVFGGIEAGKRVPWPSIFIENGALIESKKLDAKIAKAQAARKATEEEEKAREIANKAKAVEQKVVDDVKAQRELLEAMKNIAENTLATASGIAKANTAQAETNATLKAMREENKNRHLSILEKFDSPAVPVPPEPEAPPPLKWVPAPKRTTPQLEAPLLPKVIPQPEEIRPAEPQPKIEHRAKATEPPQKQLVAHCNCGKLHPVRGFWKYPDGTSIPDYSHCTDDFGRPCVPQSYEHAVVQK